MTDRPPLSLPRRAVDAHKGSFGRVIFVGGSRGMSGSIALSSIAALHCGSGLVTAAVPDRCLESVAAWHPALMTIPLADDMQGRFALDAAAQLTPRLVNVDAIGCGPGMTTEIGSLRIVERLLQADHLPCVFDADAINSLALLNWPHAIDDQPDPVSKMVLTPHPGELQRLTGAAAMQREGQIAAARSLASRTGAIVVLKGGPTVVIGHDDGNQAEWTNTNGNPGMATAGSGDVLTGVITSLLGQGLSAWDAARLGVWIHGRAGDLAAAGHGQSGMTAKELVGGIPAAMTEVAATVGA